ncbi:flavin-containing monooxygenase [Hymenobacter guriensis]|uniref:NAD(P)-binding domain-containing protein n=1 Tax=Hymenobacter guriensis TaxID=2793065 RepID=A0ABS0KW32_9BACT|nr:NAD(P)-binding domain-containing protein [Hymenobacter guriensis]MBG8552006.1 NAD(P)-binding domain-containing protein [Hymenobacter guriensis]
MKMTLSNGRIAIIGAGPSGLAACKSALEAGLEPVLFEQSGHLGGQWNQGAPHSGVWKAMHTNTSAINTRFSDFPHTPGLPLFPNNQDILAYLERYAAHFNLLPHLRRHTRINKVARGPKGQFIVWSVDGQGAQRAELFQYVIVASGRYNKPRYAQLPGLPEFEGMVLHSFHYRRSADFAGQRVLVVGNSISGLEIASELAQRADVTVLSSCRKPRYILRKTLNGRPSDCVAFTRAAAYTGQALPPAQAAEGLKQLILRTCGNPADFGAPRPQEDVRAAGISMNDQYLDLVQQGRIQPYGAVAHFTASGVVFQDGSQANIDAVILATGFDLNLPFLSDDIRETIQAGPDHIDLHHHTFHPCLPNLAFIGLFPQAGPYFPVVELQARWIAACWSGARALPSREQMEAGLAEFRAFRQVRYETSLHEMATRLAANVGVVPSLERYPELAQELLFGPLTPAQFRLEGPHAQPGSLADYRECLRQIGCTAPAPPTEEQIAHLQILAEALPHEKALQDLARELQAEPVL